MHFDLRVFWFCVIVGLIFSGIEYIRRREKRIDAEPTRIWELCRYQGGGKVYTPRAMTEEEATEYAAALGSILWIDREHGFIFYRPVGH